MKKFRNFVRTVKKDHTVLFYVLIWTNPLLMTANTIYNVCEFVRGLRLGKKARDGEITLEEAFYEAANG